MLKRLLQCVKGYKRETVLAPTFISLEVVIECIIPFITAKLVNEIERECDMNVIVKYGLILVALACGSLFCGVMSGRFAATATAGFGKNLRRDLYYKVQDFSFSNIDKFSTAGLVTRMTTDVTNVQEAFMVVIRIAVRAPLMLIFAITMAFFMSGPMALIYVGVVPLLAFALFSIIRRVMPIFKKVFHKYDDLNESVQENIEGIRVVKSFVREEHETNKFKKASGEVEKGFLAADKIIALNNPIMQLAFNASMLLVSLIGTQRIVSTGGAALGLGNYTMLLVYGAQMLSSMMMVSVVFVILTISAESVKRVAEVLNEQSTIADPDSPISTVADGSIDFENVSFKYSETAERDALSDVDLHIRSGETIGILGGTGSAKSTLVQLIPRLFDVTEGSVRVGGVDVREYDIPTLRSEVSMVLQKNVLFSGTIKENLRWGDPNATDEDLRRICRLACADEFIEALPDGYDTFIERGGTNVSGGQKQRLCIARALLKKPKILILDDSTSAVDTKTDAMIRRAFREEIPNTTKLIIAQRISSVEDADRIIVMENGRVDAVGTHEELLRTNAIYREVYESQTRAGGDENEEN